MTRWFPQWLVDFCTFSGAAWWGLVLLSLAAFVVVEAFCCVRNCVRRRRQTAQVIDIAERLTREAVQ